MSAQPWVDCPACPQCKARVALSRHDDDVTPLDGTQLRCPNCCVVWTATPAERAQAEAADAAWERERCGWRP